MQVAYSKISNTQAELLVEISGADFVKYIDQAAANLSMDIEIQGFRKGHMPRDLIERTLGTDKLYSEAAGIAVRGTIDYAIKEANLELTQHTIPEVHFIKLAANNPFIYKAVLSEPFFELCDNYAEVAAKIKKKEAQSSPSKVKVEESEVENTLQWLKKNRQQKAKNGQATIGSELKIDDDFARSIGNFNNVEELKGSIYDGIYIEKEKKEKNRVRIVILKEIIFKSKEEIPGNVIDREVLHIEDEFKDNISQMGLDYKTYLSRINKEGEELRKGWREQAKERVEFFLALDAIAKKEGIRPSEEEVKAEAQKVLNRYPSAKKAEKEIDAAHLYDYITGALKNEKTFEFLEGL